MQNTEGVQKSQTLDYQTDSLKKGKNTAISALGFATSCSGGFIRRMSLN
jgi:hypothetical protein